MPQSLLLPLAVFLPLLLATILPWAARRLGPATGYLAMAGMLGSAALLSIVAAGGVPGGRLVTEHSWIPSLDLNLTFLIDGLSLFYGFVICGIGTLVCWYSASYLGPKYRGHGRFYTSLMLFATAMLGTVFSGNALLLFVFWELTGIASFLLIGFFHADGVARDGARRALLTTGATGLCLMAGLILLRQETGSWSLIEMASAGLGEGARANAALLLVAVGIFGKSAQFPFHFWLPGAMVAPTPVSAYLHSATMVKLGVFLSARMFPIFSGLDLWFPLLAGFCFSTMLLGAWLALRSNDLKAILAWSTVSQLGLLIGAYGLGAAVGVRFDYLFILTHVLYKAGLFMMAGIVDHATGTRDVRHLGGLARRMPALAAASAVGLAALAGLPLTAGFLSKESLFAEIFSLWDSRPFVAGLILSAAMISGILSMAVALRVFIKVFLGRDPVLLKYHDPGWRMIAPVCLLAAATVVLGTFPGLFQGMFDHLRVAGLHLGDPVKLKLWHGLNRELACSAVVVAAGVWLYRRLDRGRWDYTGIPRHLRFDLAFDKGLEGLTLNAKKLTLALRADWPPAYLPIVITFLLLAMGWTAATSDLSALKFNSVDWSFNPLRGFLVVFITLAALGVVFLRRWTAQLVALSIAGFFTTLYFVLSRAPDLAMTQILVESASVVMILMLLSRFPSSSQIGVRLELGFGKKHLLKIVLSLGMGLLMALLVVIVEAFRHPDPVGPRYLALSEPLAEGTNAVNTILVDFRGFDTLGEITVLLISTLGCLGLMMRYRRTRPDEQPPPGFLLGKEKKP